MQDISHFSLQDGISPQSGLLEIAVFVVYSVSLTLSKINFISIAQFNTPGTDITFLLHCILPLWFSFFHFKTVSSIQGGENFCVQIQINRHKCTSQGAIYKKGHIPWTATDTRSFILLFSNSCRLGAGCGRASCLTPAVT